MRIAHVVKHSMHSNGNVHVAVDLACAQSDMGHDVCFISGPGSFDTVLEAHGVFLVRTPGFGRLGGLFKTLVALWRTVRRRRIEVVHAHMMASAISCFVVSRTRGVPMVTTVHNSFDRHSGIMRLGAAVVAVSDAERELLLSRGYRADKTVSVLNGANDSPREAIAVEEGRELRQPSIMVLSGLHGRKAVDDVLRAFVEASRNFPSWVLSIVGDGPDRERLEAMANDLGVESRVDFLGSSLRPRLLLDQAKIYTTATLADPCPLSVGEARAAGCAIVATKVGGIPELLDDGAAGRLVSPGSPRELASAYCELMSDDGLLVEWRNRARIGVEHLTVERMATDYLEVYRRVL